MQVNLNIKLYQLRNLLIILLLFSAHSLSASEDRLRLAVTHTVGNTGLISQLNTLFEERYATQLHVIITSSGQALRLGENGDVDVIMVHAPQAEKMFMAAGYGINHRSVMYNQFVLLGPANDPAQVQGTASIIAVMQQVKQAQAVFVSRGDQSDTHKKEQQLWQLSNSRPNWNNYRSSDQGVVGTLQLSDELSAYTLVDRASFLLMRDKLSLIIVHQGDDILHNPYHIIAVNPQKHPHVNSALAIKYIDFITSKDAQNLIGSYQIDQQQLFYPATALTKSDQINSTKNNSAFFLNAIGRSVKLIFNFDRDIFLIVWTSIKISLVAVLIATIIAIPLGILVALSSFPGRRLLLSILNTLMAVPTVIVGLLLYGLLNRQGILGEFGLLYTPSAIVLGQAILITPLIWNLSIAAANGADPRLRITCLSLGANVYHQTLIYISEVRFALIAAVITGFGRAIGEVGIAMILGGNIENFTRTMTTAIALETSKGNFEFAVALGIILLLVALLVNVFLQQFQELKQQ